MNLVQLAFDFDALEPMQAAHTVARTLTRAEKAEQAAFVLDMMDFLTAPIIVNSTNWPIPERLVEDIRQERLISGMKHEKTATLTEVVAFMYSATMEGPLQHHWENVYTHCWKHWAHTNRIEIPADIEPFGHLDSYETMLLNDLRRKIYERRRSQVKKSMKGTG